MTNKQSYAWWKGQKDKILDSTDIDIKEDIETTKKRVAHLEANPENWFRYYFPAYNTSAPAEFHVAATQRIINNPEWCEVRLWARELAKSTRTMFEVLYLCLTGKKKYVVLISNSLDNATRLLAPYKANLEFNKRIIQDYGEQENPGSWTMSEFITENGIAFRALGAGQSPRGTRNNEVRPDVILFDDIDTDDDCLNPTIVEKKWQWVEEAAIGTRSISRNTTIIFCGNRIALDCCMERATKIADFVDQVNIRDKKGQSTWKEKNSEPDIDRVLSQKSYASAQKEYFNNPLTQGTVFKEMNYKEVKPLHEYQLLICYTDPSYKDTGDYKATVLVGSINGEFHVLKCFLRKTTTAEMIDWHYFIMNLVGGNTCYYYMEEVFIQDVLIKEVSDAGRLRGKTIPIIGDRRKKANKFMRIESLLEPLNRNGKLFLNKAEQDNPHMKRLHEQFTTFAPNSRAHDDGPDAVEGAIWLLNEKLALNINQGIYCINQREQFSRRY